MLFTLKLLHDILGTNIPDYMIKKKIVSYETFKKMIISGLFHEVQRPHLRMFSYTFLLDTPQDFLKILASRFFPGSGEIRLRYGLKERSKKVYA